MISIIAGIGKNNELGKDNTLLWHMPADLAYFKKTTSGKTVIMGRKTFESIGRPLPNRRNIVITRDINYKKEGAEIANSLEEAISMSKMPFDTEVFIIGGAEIYKQAINIADKLYITKIEAEFPEADTFFPHIDTNIWHEIYKTELMPDEKNKYKMTFLVYKKH